MATRQEKIQSPEIRKFCEKSHKEFEVIKMATQIILVQFGDKEKIKELIY